MVALCRQATGALQDCASKWQRCLANVSRAPDLSSDCPADRKKRGIAKETCHYSIPMKWALVLIRRRRSRTGARGVLEALEEYGVPAPSHRWLLHGRSDQHCTHPGFQPVKCDFLSPPFDVSDIIGESGPFGVSRPHQSGISVREGPRQPFTADGMDSGQKMFDRLRNVPEIRRSTDFRYPLPATRRTSLPATNASGQR